MLGLAEILVVLLVLVLIAVGVLIAARPRSRGAAGASNLPSCGQCGYAVRGISSLECPECGADLTVVGIQSARPQYPLVAGCLMPMGFSFALFLAAILLFALLESFAVPTYSSDDFELSFLPASEEYDLLDLEIDATSIIPAGQNMTTGGFSFDTINRFTSPRAIVSLYDPGTQVIVHELRLRVIPQSGTGPQRAPVYFVIDPKTGQASWNDGKGKPQSTKGEVSDKDVLAFLGSAGADTTNADVIRESQQIYIMIDSVLNGTHQFKIDGFSSAGYGTGSSGSPGPPWFLPTYGVAWLVLWIGGLVWLLRRARR